MWWSSARTRWRIERMWRGPASAACRSAMRSRPTAARPRSKRGLLWTGRAAGPARSDCVDVDPRERPDHQDRQTDRNEGPDRAVGEPEEVIDRAEDGKCDADSPRPDLA